MKRKIYQQRNAEIQSKTYISAEVFFFLTCHQTFFVFFLRGGFDLITIQSNHLLGNPRYTLTERLLANLTDLWFRKTMALNLFNLSISFQPKHRSNSTALLPGLSHQILACVWVTLRRTISHAPNAWLMHPVCLCFYAFTSKNFTTTKLNVSTVLIYTMLFLYVVF